MLWVFSTGPRGFTEHRRHGNTPPMHRAKRDELESLRYQEMIKKAEAIGEARGGAAAKEEGIALGRAMAKEEAVARVAQPPTPELKSPDIGDAARKLKRPWM